jgi:hypothetical protein
VNDKILDLLARCLAQGLDSAEIGCVRLDQRGIELVMAN